MKFARLMTLISCAGLAAPALAQDSVSSTGAGDALDAYTASTQVVKYTAKMTPFTSAVGDSYGIVPLVKASASLPIDPFFNHLISGQAMSRHILPNTLSSGTYADWSTGGPGVNPTNNSAPGSVNLPGGSLFSTAVSFAEFGNSANNIIAGLVTFDPANPATLYVDRIVAATNQSTSTPDTDNSQFGMGVIDANLNLSFRADGFGTLGGNRLTATNIFRVNAELRANGTLNEINNSGGTDAAATERLLTNNATNHSPPTQIPEADGGPSAFGPNFLSQHVHNDYMSATTAHLTSTFAGLTSATDHRGTFGYAPITPFGGTDVGTAIALERINGTDTVDLGIYGLDAIGTPTSVAVFQAPTMIPDGIDPYIAPFAEFQLYRSQMAFRGPSGAAALSTNANGDVLAAAVFDIACVNCGGLTYGGGAGTAPIQGISVLSFDPADPAGTQSWTLAAWVDGDTGVGKPIRDGSGTVIGELTPIAVFGVAGPSISGVSMDAAGNIYFLSPFLDYGPDGMIGTADDDFDTGIFRAIYDPILGGYDLDLLIQTGQVFTSANTGLDYVITFLDIADANSSSSGTFFGHNTTYDGFPGLADPADPANHFNLGGLTFAASMIYDSNADGLFDTLTGDENYSYLFYVQPLGGSNITDCNNNGIDDAIDIANGTSTDLNGDGIPDECPGQSTRLCADVNNNGVVEASDFSAWIAAFNTLNYRADQNGGGLGAVTAADFTAWIANFNLGAGGPTCLN
ncbi:MAG TPA: hypothetical protein ENJ00_09250 [Phycisphaerales bacterium]|nr:hypothetical protein [Phycisphaerales bacterium]